MEKLKITFVGSGDYCNHGGRAQQAILFERGGQGLMVDFGANTCAQLKKLGLDYGHFQTILLTHFHGDHCGGLPYMIAEVGNLSLAGNTKFEIIGPGQTKDHIDTLCLAMGYSVASPSIFGFSDIAAYSTIQTSLCKIEALPVQHRPESLGYRLDFGDFLVAVTGDTRWCDNVPRLSAGSDLLICDCNQAVGQGGVHISLEELLLHRDELQTKAILPVHIADLGPSCPLPEVIDGTVYYLEK